MDRLTQSQQELVARHLSLVRMYVRRHVKRLPSGIRRRDFDDLVQEGMLGLMDAATHYQPERCGPFAPYALAYIHGMVCRYLLRQMDGLAMPPAKAQAFAEQRRFADTHSEPLASDLSEQRVPAAPSESLPRFLDFDSSEDTLAERACRQYQCEVRESFHDAETSVTPGWTSEQLHAFYERAIERVAAEVSASPRARIDHAALVQAVVQERLLVPDDRFRTSRRGLARRFGCAPARVWNVETRLLRLVRRRLAEQAGMSHEAASIVCSVTELPAPVPPGTPQARAISPLSISRLHGIAPGR